MVTYFEALILGIVEGITEFLPISSTGHLIITSHLLQLTESDFLKTFEIAIQLGAIMSVMVLYWRKFFLSYGALKRIIVAFFPTAVLGFFAYPIIKKFLLGNVSIVLWSLAIGGIILILFEKIIMSRSTSIEKNSYTSLESLPFLKAFWVGLFQSLAFIPGVSRAGATIIGGMLCGISRTTIVEFSFLLAVPTMAAATGYDLLKNAAAFSSNDANMLVIGGITSFLVATAAIKFFIKYIQKHTFIGFGVYRIIVAIALGILLY